MCRRNQPPSGVEKCHGEVANGGDFFSTGEPRSIRSVLRLRRLDSKGRHHQRGEDWLSGLWKRACRGGAVDSGSGRGLAGPGHEIIMGGFQEGGVPAPPGFCFRPVTFRRDGNTPGRVSMSDRALVYLWCAILPAIKAENPARRTAHPYHGRVGIPLFSPTREGIIKQKRTNRKTMRTTLDTVLRASDSVSSQGSS